MSDMSEKQAMEIASLKARDVMPSPIGDRISQLEKLTSEISEKLEQKTQGALSRLEKMHGWLQEEKDKRDMQHMSLEERVESVTNCTDKQLRGLEGLKGEYACISDRLERVEKWSQEAAHQADNDRIQREALEAVAARRNLTYR